MKFIAIVVTLAALGCASRQKVETPDPPPPAPERQPAKSSAPKPAPKAAPQQRASRKQVELSRGYAMLYELVSKQSGLDRALIIGGGMDAESKSLIREIAQASERAAARIKNFTRADPSLALKNRGLPEVEVRARAEIESSLKGRLLFAGKNFEVRLLLAQNDATEYGAALAQEMAKLDPHRERRAWLKEFAEHYGKLRQRVEERLTVRSESGK